MLPLHFLFSGAAGDSLLHALLSIPHALFESRLCIDALCHLQPLCGCHNSQQHATQPGSPGLTCAYTIFSKQ